MNYPVNTDPSSRGGPNRRDGHGLGVALGHAGPETESGVDVFRESSDSARGHPMLYALNPGNWRGPRPLACLSRDGQELCGRLEIRDRLLSWLGRHEGAASPGNGDVAHSLESYREKRNHWSAGCLAGIPRAGINAVSCVGPLAFPPYPFPAGALHYAPRRVRAWGDGWRRASARARAEAAGTGVTATKPAVASGSSVGSSSSRAVSAGGSPWMDDGACVGGSKRKTWPEIR